jgi:hypothetical protein
MVQVPEIITKKISVREFEIPLKLSERVRLMVPGDAMEVPEEKRQKFYNVARMAFPLANWGTKKHEGKCYLIRLA